MRTGKSAAVMAIGVLAAAVLTTHCFASWGDLAPGKSSAMPESSSWHFRSSASESSSSAGQTTTSNTPGEFNGQAYVRSETTTRTVNPARGDSYESTKTAYYNADGKIVGEKTAGKSRTYEKTYVYDAQGRILKETTTASGGWHKNATVTSVKEYAYEQLKDAGGAVTAEKVTISSTRTLAYGNGKENKRVETVTRLTDAATGKVTESGTSTQTRNGTQLRTSTWTKTFDKDGKLLTENTTRTYSNGSKITVVKEEGKAAVVTHYDKDGKAYTKQEWKDFLWQQTRTVVKEMLQKAKEKNQK